MLQSDNADVETTSVGHWLYWETQIVLGILPPNLSRKVYFRIELCSFELLIEQDFIAIITGISQKEKKFSNMNCHVYLSAISDL